MIDRDKRVFVAGHTGLVGSAILRRLQREGFSDLLTRPLEELDLSREAEAESFLSKERPRYVFLAAAKVGGILANSQYPGDFIRENLRIQVNVLDAARRHGVEKLLFLGSSCIYPKHAPQPMKEEALLTGPLEPTNSAYALAKIAGLGRTRPFAAEAVLIADPETPEKQRYRTRDVMVIRPEGGLVTAGLAPFCERLKEGVQ